MKTPRSPQDKKTLSYVKDRRNSYGENDKASRKAIPARKAGENRKSRRKANHALAVVQRVDEVAADLIENAIVHDLERVGGWTKAPDCPLGEVVKRTTLVRAWSHGRKGRVRVERERQMSDPDYTGTIMICSLIHDSFPEPESS